LKAQKDIQKDVEEIANNEAIDIAILRLNGYFKHFFWNNHLRNAMGNLYIQKKDLVKAGKMLYFKDNPSEIELKAIDKFKESCKNNKYRIFQELVTKSKLPRGIDMNMSSKMFRLILGIANDEGALPIHVVRWIWYFERIRNIEIKNNWVR